MSDEEPFYMSEVDVDEFRKGTESPPDRPDDVTSQVVDIGSIKTNPKIGELISQALCIGLPSI